MRIEGEEGEGMGWDDMYKLTLHLSSTSAPCCRYFRAKLKSTSLPWPTV